MLWGVGRFLLLGFPPLASCLCAFLDGPAPLLAVAVHLRLECGEERAHIEVGQQAVEHLVPVAPAAVGLPAVVEQCLEELPRLLVVEFVEDAAHGVVVDDERLLPLAPGSGGVVVWFHNDSFFKGLTKKGFFEWQKRGGGTCRRAVRVRPLLFSICVVVLARGRLVPVPCACRRAEAAAGHRARRPPVRRVRGHCRGHPPPVAGPARGGD